MSNEGIKLTKQVAIQIKDIMEEQEFDHSSHFLRVGVRGG